MKKKIGMIFPGQGSQYLGMGKELYDKHRIVQEYFEEAGNCLNHNFVKLCFASSENELKQTINAQTSVFLLSASIFSLLKEKYGIIPNIVAGHSSGEYTAIFAAEGMTFPDVIYLLKKRAEFMDAATKNHMGVLLAVLGISYEVLKKICNRYDDVSSNQSVAEIVNYNAPQQLVVSGTLSSIEQVYNDVKSAGGKAIKIPVAGAVHSRLMKDAAKQFALYMVKVDFKDLSIPLISNINAEVATSNEEIKHSLKNQICSHVQWWPSMQKFIDCDIIIEVGPSGKLSKALKREWPDKEIISVSNNKDIETLLLLLGKSVATTLHSDRCDKETCAKEDIIVLEEYDSQEIADTIVIECVQEEEEKLPKKVKDKESLDEPHQSTL
jgi:[acyl-carrier-protein] S-malonyltransferase